MKRITSMILILAMLASLAMVSCEKDTQDPANTAGTTTPAVTTEAVSTTAETDADIENFDVDAFLADCTVYDVTVETQDTYYNELYNTPDNEKPKKIVLNITDAEKLNIFMEYTGNTEYPYSYKVKYISNDNVSFQVPDDEQLFCRHIGFYVRYKNGTTVIQYNDGIDNYSTVCIINGIEYDILRNTETESGYSFNTYMEDDGTVKYQKINTKYNVDNLPALMQAYESENDFYDESGSIVFEGGKAVLKTETIRNIEDFYNTDFSNYYKEYANHFGAKSFGELVEIYKNYLNDDRENEFLYFEETQKLK